MESEGVDMEALGGSTELQSKKQDPASAKASTGKKRKQREFAFLTIDRPARERKSIERLIVSPEKEVKVFKIPKGPGTALKDIPNVVFKLSKRRGNDEVVQTLHKVLFSKTSKAAKANILQFSGFVWSENEEKDKAKTRERLEKLVKEILVQISDLLDLSSARSLKKEDAVLKVFEFLESPHKTSDKLLEEVRKSKKSKKLKKTPVKGSKRKATSKSSRKSPKGATKQSRTEKEASDDEENEGNAPDFEDDVEEELEDKSDDDYAKETGSSTKKRARKSSKEEPVHKSDDDYAKGTGSSTKKRARNSSKEEPVHESEDDEEMPPKKKKSIKEVKKDRKQPIPKAKRERKPKAKGDEAKEPSNEALREGIRELLENADFSKVTFTDVMKQLGEKFNTDLTHKKAYLKSLIHEEIQKLVGEGDDEDEEGDKDDEEGKDEDEEGDNEGEIDDNEDRSNRDDEPEEQVLLAGSNPNADNVEEEGDDEQGVSDRGKEDSDNEKLSGDGGDNSGKSAENKTEDEVEGEDEKGQVEHSSEAEDDLTEKA